MVCTATDLELASIGKIVLLEADDMTGEQDRTQAKGLAAGNERPNLQVTGEGATFFEIIYISAQVVFPEIG